MAVALLLLAALPARAQISAELRSASPGDEGLLLVWTAEAGEAGPFHLLKRTLPLGERVSDHWPLDPVADLYLSDVASPLSLRRSEELADGEGLRIYALVSESGACSNASYLLLQDPAADGDPDSPHAWNIHVALPWRGGERSLAELRATHPTLIAASVRTRDRWWFSERRPDGNWSPPVEGFVHSGTGVSLWFSGAEPIVLLGSAEPSPRPILAGGWGGFGEPDQSLVSLRFGTTIADSLEFLCGTRDVDWTDDDGDGCPDQCPAGVIQDRPNGRVLRWAGAGGFGLHEVARNGDGYGCLQGWLFEIDPVVGLIESAREPIPPEPSPAPNLWLPDDVAAPAACRCADSDGDGTDDCTEALLGTDPDDPLSRGPDHDRDGVPDDEDLCPATADPGQEDRDGDGRGDACDPCPDDDPACVDEDGDGLDLYEDNCPFLANADQADEDFDGLGDACDPCPSVFDLVHRDEDGDGAPDLCDCVPDGVNGAEPPAHAELRLFREQGDPPRRVYLDWSAADRRFGPELTWDVASGDLERAWSLGFAESAGCLDRDIGSELVRRDATGSAWFTVRGRNLCGLGPWAPPGGDSPLDDADPCP